MRKYDVIIIGAGMGGLITGALLAQKAERKVLVLEAQPTIGGKVASFGGPHGEFTANEFSSILRGVAGITIIDSKPGLEEIVNRGLFREHIIDVGWHGLETGTRARCRLLAKSLGKDLPVIPHVGMMYYSDDGRWLPLEAYAREWPKSSVEELTRVNSERLAISNKESNAFDHVDLKSYLKSVTGDENVRNFLFALSGWQNGINDPKRISAGEWIRTNNLVSTTGTTHMSGIGLGTIGGGMKGIADVFAAIIKENGGEVRTKARVKEVKIKNYQAKSVVVDQNGSVTEIEAPIIVSNLPMEKVTEIIPAENFPEDFHQRMKTTYPMAGLLGLFKVKELMETKYPKAQFIVPDLTKFFLQAKLSGGATIFGWEQLSAVDPSRILKGNGHLIQTWYGISAKDPDEIHDMELLNRLAQAEVNFFRKQYPKFDDILEWYFIEAAERVYGVSPSPSIVGDRRPRVRHPLIRNLYFTGDTVEQWDIGTSAAAHGGIICASAVAEKDFLKLLPEYMR